MHDESHPHGKKLPTDRVYRVRVVAAFLTVRASLHKLECFRDILEEHAYRLTDRRSLSDLVPFILTEEQTKIRGETTDSNVLRMGDTIEKYRCNQYF